MKPLPILITLTALLCALPATAADLPQPTPTTVNVTQYGAVGDGKSDDTAAFQQAIEKAKLMNASVTVPKGKYKITGILELNATSMVGEMTGAWGADAVSLPEIVFPGKEGGIRLLAGGSVHGLLFTHDWQGKDPSERIPTIELAGIGCRVSDVKIAGAWNAIWGTASTNPARSMINNVFIVDVHNTGIGLAGTYDVTWINNVEIWSPGSKTFPKTGTGMLLGKNDMLLVSNCFVFTANVGYKFTNDYPGFDKKDGTWGTFTSCNSDFCGTGIEITGKHSLSFSGGTHWTHWHGMVIKDKGADVRISGVEFGSNGGPALWIDGGKTVAVSGCQIRRNAQNFNAPALKITGGEATALSGCVITSSTKGVEVKDGLENVVLSGNVVKENVNE